jgi:uncharacterized membrane protein
MNFFKKISTLLIIIFVFVLFCCVPQTLGATEGSHLESDLIFEAKVVEVIDDGVELFNDLEAEFQLLRVQLKTDFENDQLIVKHGGIPVANFESYQVGDRVFIKFSKPLAELDLQEVIDISQANIVTRARYQDLLVIFLIFIALVLIVNRFKGVRSILSLALSFFVIFQIVLPMLLKGVDPILAALVLVLLIIPISFYLTHGFKKKTHVATVATVIALLISTLLAMTFISTTHISGLSSEEVGFLSVERPDQINLEGLFLAGIIIGLLGTLDDVTITQAGVVFGLKKNKPSLSFRKLYSEAMEIGQDHISSMVNTLILVYTGASLPLLLLFINNPHPLAYVMSQEIVVEEIVRMMIGSTGLIFAAPLTTFLAVLLANKEQLSAKLQVK